MMIFSAFTVPLEKKVVHLLVKLQVLSKVDKMKIVYSVHVQC